MREALGVDRKRGSVRGRGWFQLHLFRVGVLVLMTYLVPALLLAPALVSCGPYVFVSAYDEKTDEGITALQKEVDALLDALNTTPVPDYKATQPSYDSIRANLATLRTRNELRTKNSLTLAQLKEFADAFAILEGQHQKGTLNQAMVAPARDSLDQICRALLKLELEKKEPKS